MSILELLVQEEPLRQLLQPKSKVQPMKKSKNNSCQPSHHTMSTSIIYTQFWS